MINLATKPNTRALKSGNMSNISQKESSNISGKPILTDGGKSASAEKCHSNPTVSCSDCRLSELCLPIALSEIEIDQLDDIVQRGRPLNKGDHLFRETDAFKCVYAVRSGSFKSYRLAKDGTEQITGFFLPGEILGMDGVSNMKHQNAAIAMEHSSVCRIPFEQLETLSAKLPSLQHRFFQIMGNEIAKEQCMLTLLSCNSAEEKIAALLLSFSSRNARRQMPEDEIILSMTRAEIGNYLGITVETVSRIFTSLAKRSLIEVNSKVVKILDLVQLKEIAKVQ